jgi:site-specific DNA-methyltransferase (adenine-specific)/modification methylase
MNPVVIGNATLYLGDCLEILPTLPAHDLCLTDPPYGIGENRKKVMSRGKLAPVIDYGEFDWDAQPAANEQIAACRVAAPKNIIWGGNYFDLPPASKWLVWDKLNTGDFADAELAWTNIHGAVRVFRHLWNGMIRASERAVPRVHPTQKPVALMAWCLEQAGKPETTIDPFMGSGSTGIACAQLGLSFIGIEIDPRYFDIACRRIEDAQRQSTLALDPAA